MQGMLAVLVRLADQNGSLPALHDGPYRRAPYAREIAEIVEIGLSVYGDKSYRRLLDNVYRELNGEAGRIGMLEALLYGTGHWDGRYGMAASEVKDSHRKTSEGVWEVGDVIEVRVTREVQGAGDAEHANQAGNETEGKEARKARDNEGRNQNDLPDLSASSVFLPHSGFALLKSNHSNGLQALVDFGPHGGSHGHFDKLNLCREPATIARPWYRTVRFDPEEGMVSPYSLPQHRLGWTTLPESDRRKCIRYESGSDFTYLWVRSDQAYEQGVLDRHLILTDDWLLDWFEVELEEPAAVDWWFHYIGQGELSGLPNADQGHVVTDLGNEDGYAYVKAARTSCPRMDYNSISTLPMQQGRWR